MLRLGETTQSFRSIKKYKKGILVCVGVVYLLMREEVLVLLDVLSYKFSENS